MMCQWIVLHGSLTLVPLLQIRAQIGFSPPLAGGNVVIYQWHQTIYRRWMLVRMDRLLSQSGGYYQPTMQKTNPSSEKTQHFPKKLEQLYLHVVNPLVFTKVCHYHGNAKAQKNKKLAAT